MSGTHRCLAALESPRELFVNYPFRAEISAMDQLWRPGIIRSASADHRGRNRGMETHALTRNTLAWRTPSGAELFVATAGRVPESDEMPVAVMTGPIPHDCHLDHDLEPGISAGGWSLS